MEKLQSYQATIINRTEDDRKLLFEPEETLTQKSGKFQPFFLFLIQDQSLPVKRVVLEPDRIGPHLLLVACYTALGRTEEADAEVSEVLRINPKFSLEKQLKMVSVRDQSAKARAARDRVFDLYRKAGLPE